MRPRAIVVVAAMLAAAVLVLGCTQDCVEPSVASEPAAAARPAVGTTHAAAPTAPAAAAAAAPVGADGARHFGRGCDRTRAVTPLAAVMAEPARFADQTVKTEGEITRVCQAMGCWMEIRAGEGSQAIHVPMAGHAFFLPRDVAGKRATIEGRVSVRERTPEQIQHLQGEGSEVAALSLSIEATGVEVR